ncbi:MAG TPA: ABC transporter permease [Steroidobacteraceae bacterium]
MKSWLLVWAALWRKPAATVLIAAATSAAFTLFGLMIGLYETRQQMLDSARTDEIFVNRRYSDDPDITGLPLSVGSQIARLDGVASVGAYKWFGGYRTNPKDQIWIFTVGEGMEGARPDAPVTREQWRLLFSNPSGVLVTRDKAQTLNLKEGDAFAITSVPGLRADGGRTWAFQVLAVVPEIPEFPDGVVIGNMHYIENAAPPAIQALGYAFWISIKDASRAAQISKAIDNRFFNSAMATYSIPVKADALELAQSNVNKTSMVLTVAGSGLFMILFLVGNAVARSVHERLPEFAMLHALGLRESRLRRLVFMEAAAPCLLGATLGTALAAALTRLPSRDHSTNLNLMITPHLPASVLGWAIVSAILLALLSSVLPLVKLKRMSVAEILAGR